MTTEQTTAPTVDEQIARAEESGDWMAAMRLKTARVKEQHNPSLAPDADRQQRIVEAEQSGDWMTSMRLKVQSLEPADEPRPVDIGGPAATAGDQGAPAADAAPASIDDEIAQAEAAGDWTTSMRLKLKRAGS